MVEFIFNSSKPKAEVKIVLTSNNKINKNQLLSETEAKELNTAIKGQKFTGKIGESIELFDGKTTIILFGTGKNPTNIELQTIGGKLVKKLHNHVDADILVKDTNTAYNLAFGMDLGGYRFDKYFTKKEDDFYPKLEKIEFFSETAKPNAKEYHNYQALATAVRYGRDLCNEPANYLTPKVFADDIKRLEHLGLKVEILDEKQIKAAGMGMLLSVAQGSANQPRVAVIKWQGNKTKKFNIGLIGKGVTFDSGGISLKPSANMGDMKGDMTGAAVVVSTLKAAALQKNPMNIIGIVGLVENMPSGTATRPGDIVTSMSGQTVEIDNTDAEGRLVLGDCLWYLQTKFEPTILIDIATLTGSVMATFGAEYAGLFSNSDSFAQELLESGLDSGEKLWRLPINEEYNKMMDSDIADMKNAGGRLAGGITAACFLQRFVKPDTSWAHLDIAGVDKDEKGHPLTPKGATAFGIRLLTSFLNRR